MQDEGCSTVYCEGYGMSSSTDSSPPERASELIPS
jgi:hypothetical protein